MGYRRPWALLPLVLAVACTRQAWVGPVATDPVPSALTAGLAPIATTGATAVTTPGPTGAEAAVPQRSVRVTAPRPGDSVSSPVAVAALAGAPVGARVVGTVSSFQVGAAPRWRGNAELRPVGPDRHGGSIPFDLDTGGPGVVEVAVVRDSDGAVLARAAVSVTLVPGR